MNKAYDANTNTALERAKANSGLLEHVGAGTFTPVVAKEIDWDKLGLDPSIHGDEVMRLANEILSDRHFNPNTYGGALPADSSQKTTSELLDSIAVTDVGEAESKILAIVDVTKEFSASTIQQPRTLLGKLFRRGIQSIEDHRRNYDSVSRRIDGIVADIGKVTNEIHRSTKVIENLQDINSQEYHAASIKIAAGRHALNCMIAEMGALNEDGTQSDVRYDVRASQVIHGLEKRLHDLELGQLHRAQQAPQYELMLHNNRTLVSEFEAIGTTLIPTWRTGITMALTIDRAQKSAEMINTIKDATSEYMIQNSNMLRQANIDIAKTSQRGMMDVEALAKVQENLTASVTEVLNIQREGAAKREADIKKVRELQGKIGEIATGAVQSAVNRIANQPDEDLVLQQVKQNSK